jgi:hypothetical protein
VQKVVTRPGRTAVAAARGSCSVLGFRGIKLYSSPFRTELKATGGALKLDARPRQRSRSQQLSSFPSIADFINRYPGNALIV